MPSIVAWRCYSCGASLTTQIPLDAKPVTDATQNKAHHVSARCGVCGALRVLVVSDVKDPFGTVVTDVSGKEAPPADGPRTRTMMARARSIPRRGPAPPAGGLRQAIRVAGTAARSGVCDQCGTRLTHFLGVEGAVDESANLAPFSCPRCGHEGTLRSLPGQRILSVATRVD